MDEARLSPNRFEYTNDETAKLLNNYDQKMVRLPSPHDYVNQNYEKKGYSRQYRTEVYLFWSLRQQLDRW